MDLKLDLRLRLSSATEAEREAVREVVVIEARRFTATLADALERTGVEVEVQAVDHARGRWQRLIRS